MPSLHCFAQLPLLNASSLPLATAAMPGAHLAQFGDLGCGHCHQHVVGAGQGAAGPQLCPALLPGAALGGGKGQDMRVLLALCPHVPVSPEPPCPELQPSVGSSAASAPVLWESCPGLFCLPAAGGTGAPKNRRKEMHGTQSRVQQVKKAKHAHSPGEVQSPVAHVLL